MHTSPSSGEYKICVHILSYKHRIESLWALKCAYNWRQENKSSRVKILISWKAFSTNSYMHVYVQIWSNIVEILTILSQNWIDSLVNMVRWTRITRSKQSELQTASVQSVQFGCNMCSCLNVLKVATLGHKYIYRCNEFHACALSVLNFK